MNVDFDAVKKAAEGYKADMSKFLRDMIAIPSESCDEEKVVKRIAAEMEKLGYDKVEIDGLGNVIGWMGEGDKIIAIDSHIDTVGIGNINNWNADPYTGYETDEVIYGRGGSDQEGGMASATYGVKIMKDLEAAVKLKRATENRKKGALKAKARAEARKARGLPPKKFITCPTCDAKSKMIRTEMGGVQTRTCQNGHHFEIDTWGGMNVKRRVERTDRPFMVFNADGTPGNYTDYVYGKYKNDPAGKQDK